MACRPLIRCCRELCISSGSGFEPAAETLVCGSAKSDPKRTLIRKKRGCPSSMYEDDILAFSPTSFPDQSDQTCEPFAGIDWIEWQGFELARQSDCFDRGRVWDAVGWSRVPCNDFNGRFDERNIEHVGRFACKRNDVSAHAPGFGIDVDSNDPRIRHCQRCADDKSGLSSGAARAMDDCAWSETQLGGLGVELANHRGIGDRTERIRDAIWNKIRFAAASFEIADECANRSIAISGPRDVAHVRAKEPIEKGIARGFVFRRWRLKSAVIDGKMAVQSELGRDSCNLSLAIRLHDTTRYNCVGTARNCLVQHIVKFAELVAAEAEAGGILALNPKLRPAEVSRQLLHRFQRGRKLRQSQARERGESFA